MDNNNTMEYRIGLEKQNKRNDQVTELILDNCRASQIIGLTDEFVNLEMLSLINVGLTTLKGFPKLPKLRKLELSDNRLTGGLNLLHGSSKLQHLNLSGNRIKDLEALEPLKEFHELVSLDLYHCEITKTEDYRKKVFDLLPNLKALDGYDKFDAEVADSDEDEDESSDVDNHIARNDNDLEEEDGPEDGDDGQDDDDDNDDEDLDEEDYSSSEGSQMNDEELGDAEGHFDEEGDDDDDDDDDDLDEDEEEDIEQNSSGLISVNTTANNDNRTHEDLDDDDDDEDDEDDDDVQEVDGDDGGDIGEEEEDDEAEDDLKLLQKDSIVDDEDDADFEPTHEPDERDHEIDPEDDADEENEGNESGQLSTSALDSAAPKEVDSADTRGQKRKFEDEGGDEGNEADGGQE